MIKRGILASLACLAVAAPARAEAVAAWTVTPEAAAVANPVASTPEAIAAGRKTYLQNCLICHGASGKGDGDGAAYLIPKPASFLEPAVAKQSDGALFAKVTAGRNTMPGWKELLKDQQRWELVVYLRTLVPAIK